MDQLHALLPGNAAGRIRLCALARLTPQYESAGVGSRVPAGAVAGISAHRAAGGVVESRGWGRSFGADSAAVGGDHRRSVFVALRHHAAVAALVPFSASRRVSLAVVCVVEFRQLPGAVELPVFDRTVSAVARADRDLVRSLRGFRGVVRVRRVASPRSRSGTVGRRRKRVGESGVARLPAVDIVGGVRLRAAAGHHDTDHAGNRRDPVFVDRAAVHLPTHFCVDVRKRPLVPSRRVRRNRGCAGAGHVYGGRGECRGFGVEATGRLFSGVIRELHGVPWRACALASIAASSHRILFDDLGGRRDRRRLRGIASSAHLRGEHGIPVGPGRGVFVGISGVAARRRVGAMDRPQLFGARTADGADVRRGHQLLHSG